MIKKIISVILSIMLMASMFTGVVFAQETTATVSGTGAVTVKDGSTYGGVSAQKWTRIAFALYDFSDYIPYLYGADSVTFSASRQYSSQNIYGLILDALDDSKEQYVNTSLTWADTYGSYAMGSGGYRLAIKEDTTAAGSVTLSVDKANLISALETGDNGVVAVRFDSDSGSNSEVVYHNFSINYNDETYMQTIADGLMWSDVSDVAQDSVAGVLDLPSKLCGCDVTWQSSSSAIDVATGNVTAGANDQVVTLTATLSHNGKTATKAFDVTVASKPVTKVTVNKSVSVYVRGGSDAPTQSGVVQDSSSYLMTTAGSQYRAYVKFDLSGNEAFIENLASAKFSMKVGGPYSGTKASPFNLVLLPDSAESYVTDGMVYNDATSAGITNASAGTVVASQDTVLANGTVYESTDIAAAIKNAIDANPANSSVLFGIYSTSGQGYFHSQTPVITLEYYEDEVDADAFFNAKKDALEWSHISSQPIDDVKEDLTLPSKFYGFDVSWESDNELAVASDGTVTRGDTKGKATLTATVSYNGKSAEKEFEITVPRIAYAYGEELYDGTKSISKGATDANFTIESADGVYGKVASDKVYKISAQSSGTFAIIDTSAATDANDVFEFSAYVPENAGNLNFNIGIVDGSDYGAQALLTIKNDGIYNNYSKNKNIISEFNDGWHTFAFVAPKGDGVDNTFELYIDGKKVSENPIAVTTSGFRHIRVSAGGTDINVASGYMDNIRTYSGEYTPKYDTLGNISYAEGINGKNLLIKGERTVAEIKEGITADEDTSIRIYQNLAAAPLADAEYVKDGYIVVAASKSGTEIERSFNVYIIDRLECEATIKTLVNGSQAKVYNSGDTLRAEVEFNSYVDNKAFDATLYVAQYKYGELINLWTEPKTNITDGYTFTCDFENITDIENSNIKIMLVDDEFNPYCETGKMRFNNSNTEATLYLLGDSIVQTYEEPSYPIQGWGNFIGNYLNDSITVDNRATSGWSTDHYLYPEEKGVTGTANEYKTWENIKSDLKAGDYVMVSLGINDAGSAQISEEKYRENLETIYSEATAIGATVIFTTPTILGKDWGFTGMGFGYGGYESRGAICQSIADGHNSVCLPLGAELLQLYNGMAEEYFAQNPDKTRADANNYVGNYFHIYAKSSTNPPEGWDNFGTATEDDTMHYNPTGANKVASVIAQLIMESDSSLADYVVIPNN